MNKILKIYHFLYKQRNLKSKSKTFLVELETLDQILARGDKKTLNTTFEQK